MLLLLLFFLINGPLSAQQYEPGFYLTQERTRDCEKTIKLSPRKKDFLCLTPKPIIDTNQFVSISDIVVDNTAGLSYADLTITEDAVRVLKALASSFRGSTMVLILNDRLAGILNYNESPFIRESQIRISVRHLEGDMTQVHNELKAIVEENGSKQ